MAWIMLFAAGLLEILWASMMKLSDGFTRPLPTTILVVSLVGSFLLLAAAMRTLPLGTAYGIWTGIGAVGAFLVGIFFLGEAITAGRLIAAAMIVGGIILMKVSS